MNEKDFPEIVELLKLISFPNIVTSLQEIMKKILLETEIRIEAAGNIVVIEPVCIEAYYFNKGVFEDFSVHKIDGLQTNHFGKLYIHRAGGKNGDKDSSPLLENRGGIDLCLSSGEYCLSFLIRDAYVKINDSEFVFIDGPGRLIKFLSGHEAGEPKLKADKEIITFQNYKDIENQSVLFHKHETSVVPVYNSIRINIPYNRKVKGVQKIVEEKSKEKYVFALLKSVKGM